MNSNGRDARQIKRIRNEILVALSVVYPAALEGDRLMHSLLVLFPTLEFEQLKRDLHYLCEKEYVTRVTTTSEAEPMLIPWRRRWFRLTAKGMELADHCINDPALEE